MDAEIAQAVEIASRNQERWEFELILDEIDEAPDRLSFTRAIRHDQ
ncbi:hypothetical protein V5P93_001033 [Actinokineospora auranticolor]|uniref:Uncharacterized protein n=1 Tax=Actinokineospora auranticolor TaxID=155976 RepID=A0A2S6GE13_9PSEU|nr:hypothetical protein [Actinokineospora auranticolor]PPK63465.1 hypothetical protein CLV40_12878 [Actinokineospora auranticolor]